MSDKPRKSKKRLDYQVFHETGEKVEKSELQLKMATPVDKLKQDELDLVDEIDEFIEDNPLRWDWRLH